MKTFFKATGLSLILISTPALADNHTNINEHPGMEAKADEAVRVVGCTGGEASVDGDLTIVKGASCEDGTYDLTFDSKFKMKDKTKISK